MINPDNGAEVTNASDKLDIAFNFTKCYIVSKK